MFFMLGILPELDCPCAIFLDLTIGSLEFNYVLCYDTDSRNEYDAMVKW